MSKFFGYPWIATLLGFAWLVSCPMSSLALAHSGHGGHEHESAPIQHFLFEPIHAPLIVVAFAMLVVLFVFYRSQRNRHDHLEAKRVDR